MRTCPTRSLPKVLLLISLACALPLAASSADDCGFEGLEPGGIYNHPVNLHPRGSTAGYSLRLNGEPFVPGRRVAQDGRYLAELLPEGPLVGRKICPPLSFSLDSTAPEIRLSRPSYLPEGALPRVEIIDQNIDPKGPALFLDGLPYDPTQERLPGEHVFEVRARDLAGNETTLVETLKLGSCQIGSWIEHRPASNILSAAFYFPWYKASPECPANSVWCNCAWGPKQGNPRPALGFYGSDQQSKVNAHLDQMKAHGVDVVAIEWTGQGNVSTNIDSTLVPALASRGLTFVFLYDSFVRLAPGQFPTMIDFDSPAVRTKFIGDFQNFALSTKAFKHPRYLKFNGKPVIYMFITRAIVGSNANIRNTFTAARQAAINAGFSGIYLVADHMFWGTIDYQKLRLIDPGAVSCFSPADPSQGVPQGSAGRPIRQWASRMANLYTNTRNALPGQGLPFVDINPSTFIQLDFSGLDSAQCFGLPSQFIQRYHLRDASDWNYMLWNAGRRQAYVAVEVAQTATCQEFVSPGDAGFTSIVFNYSFNEWYEGAGFEELTQTKNPYPYGFGLAPLQVLKQVLP